MGGWAQTPLGQREREQGTGQDTADGADGYRTRPGPDIPQPVIITFDELEVLKLVDIDGLYQEEAARVLGICRRTLWSDLKRARWKVATALVHGRPIQIIGGVPVHMQGAPDRPADRLGGPRGPLPNDAPEKDADGQEMEKERKQDMEEVTKGNGTEEKKEDGRRRRD